MDLNVIMADIDLVSVINWLVQFRAAITNPTEKMDKDKLLSDLNGCIDNLDEAAKIYKNLQMEYRTSRQRTYDLEVYILNQLKDLMNKEQEIDRLNKLTEELKKGL